MRRHTARTIEGTKFYKDASKATVDAGNLTLRTLVLINGGAAVAVLAFIGGLIGQGKLSLEGGRDVASSLALFAWGVVAAVAAMGSAHVTNYCIAEATAKRRPIFDPPFFEEVSRSERWRRTSVAFHILAIALTVSSLALFVYGVMDVRAFIGRLK